MLLAIDVGNTNSKFAVFDGETLVSQFRLRTEAKRTADAQAKREAEAKRFIKSFEEDPEMEILNGPYGPYISYKKKNYRLPKDKKESAAGLTFDECMKIINAETEKPKKTPRARGKKKA